MKKLSSVTHHPACECLDALQSSTPRALGSPAPTTPQGNAPGDSQKTYHIHAQLLGRALCLEGLGEGQSRGLEAYSLGRGMLRLGS